MRKLAQLVKSGIQIKKRGEVLEKDRIKEAADVERVSREMRILKLVKHPHVIQLYEIIETPRQLYLIMESTRSLFVVVAVLVISGHFTISYN